MIIEIDQSGKIENTHHNTIIAFSDDISKTILIKGRDKREIQKIFRQIGKSRIFVYKLFALLIFFLIKDHLEKIDKMIIDEEYQGKSHLIKNILLQEIRKKSPHFPAKNITFAKIGKKSKAHILAGDVAHKKIKSELEIVTKDILKFILK